MDTFKRKGEGMRYLLVIAAVLVSFSTSFAQPHHDVDVSVNFSFNELNEYGEWVPVAGYGRVWRPYADRRWRPFMYGRWVWSTDGWLWDSDEPFGWVAYHYGNWYYDHEWGWVWVPGYDWSPARVDWYVTDYEVGWAPMPPPHRHGYQRYTHVDWNFCPINRFAGVEVHSHVVVRPHRGTVVVERQRPPRVEVVRRRSNTKIVRVTPHKVTVHSNKRNFVRVKPSVTVRSKVVSPVGPKYRSQMRRPGTVSKVKVESSRPTVKKTVTVKNKPHPPFVQHPPKRSVTVERSAPSRTRSVTVTKGTTARKPFRPGVAKKKTVTVKSAAPRGVKKVKVESEDEDENGKKTVKVKSKVKVRSRH
jgi:hypothetical protein